MRFPSALLGTLVLLGGVLALANAASAHASVKTADHKFELTYGFRSEPPYAGFPNGLDLEITRSGVEEFASAGLPVPAGTPADDEPVTWAVGNVTATFEYAGKTFVAPSFRAQFGKEGAYTADITPTVAGNYVLHVTGTLNATQIDVRINPKGPVVDPESTMFPTKDSSSAEKDAKIAALEKSVADLNAKVDAMKTNTQATPTLTPATGPTKTPTLGLVALALGVVAAALIVRRRR